MLHTNLSTRPFYNERAVRALIALVALAVLVLSGYNAAQMVSLTRQQRELSVQAAEAERQARDLRVESERMRAALDRGQVESLQRAAAEANRLIDKRTFSWTRLFNQFEATLPGDVRITSVTPQSDSEGRLLLAVNVVSRRIEDLDTFIRQLEGTGAFRAVMTRQEERLQDGSLRSAIQGYYGEAAGVVVPESEPEGVVAPPPDPGSEGAPQ